MRKPHNDPTFTQHLPNIPPALKGHTMNTSEYTHAQQPSTPPGTYATEYTFTKESVTAPHPPGTITPHGRGKKKLAIHSAYDQITIRRYTRNYLDLQIGLVKKYKNQGKRSTNYVIKHKFGTIPTHIVIAHHPENPETTPSVWTLYKLIH